jgi:5'-3' exonuclease
VIAKFGVRPESIPDYLALVGDSADGYPGLRGWGAKSTAAVLAKYGHIEAIPRDYLEWHVNASGVGTLAATLYRDLDLALLSKGRRKFYLASLFCWRLLRGAIPLAGRNCTVDRPVWRLEKKYGPMQFI